MSSTRTILLQLDPCSFLAFAAEIMRILSQSSLVLLKITMRLDQTGREARLQTRRRGTRARYLPNIMRGCVNTSTCRRRRRTAGAAPAWTALLRCLAHDEDKDSLETFWIILVSRRDDCFAPFASMAMKSSSSASGSSASAMT